MEPGIFTWKREAKGHAAIWKRMEIISVRLDYIQ